MSYVIVRNEKLTRNEAKGRYVHNERKTRGHTNKDIDQERTHLNYYFKKNELSYIKEFDKLRKENDLKGHIKSNSIIMCEMIFTSDKEFFDNIGEEETKRYFEESYKFVCNYKKLGEENIISAVIHLDEGVPHMHLVFVPVVHTKDKEGNEIDKICSRDFWKGRDSYRILQNNFYDYIISKGFNLERGLPIEETGAKHYKIEELKNSKIGNLSTGQTQRVGLARCLVHNPQYYILDEATTGLDIISSQIILDFIKEEKKKGKTILYSTHYMEEAENICDKVIMINKGQVIETGTPDEIKRKTNTTNLRDSFFNLIGGVSNEE